MLATISMGPARTSDGLLSRLIASQVIQTTNSNKDAPLAMAANTRTR